MIVYLINLLNQNCGEFKANYITDTKKSITNTIKKEAENLEISMLEQAKEDATQLIINATNRKCSDKARKRANGAANYGYERYKNSKKSMALEHEWVWIQ